MTVLRLTRRQLRPQHHRKTRAHEMALRTAQAVYLGALVEAAEALARFLVLPSLELNPCVDLCRDLLGVDRWSARVDVRVSARGTIRTKRT